MSPISEGEAVIPKSLHRGLLYLREIQDSRFKILYSDKPMHYNGTEINSNIQYQYLHAHDRRMDVAQ